MSDSQALDHGAVEVGEDSERGRSDVVVDDSVEVGRRPMTSAKLGEDRSQPVDGELVQFGGSGPRHLGHRNVIAYSGRPFRDTDHMSGTLIERWNCTVAPVDEVIGLGDFAMGRKRMVNVGVDVWDYAPVAENALAELITQRP